MKPLSLFVTVFLWSCAYAPLVPAAPPEEAKQPAPRVVGKGTSSADQGTSTCLRSALRDARAQATTRVPTHLLSAFLDIQRYHNGKDDATLQSYALHLQNALVVLDYDRDEDVSYTTDGHGTRCEVRARARVLGTGKPAPGFQFTSLDLDQPAYFEGDSAKLRFSVSRDARVYVLDKDENDNVTLLVPNRRVPDPIAVEANQRFVFPDELSSGKVELRAALPEGKSSSVEVLHLIAVRGSVDLFDEADARARELGDFTVFELGTMNRVIERLAAVDRSTWTMALVPFRIEKKREGSPRK